MTRGTGSPRSRRASPIAGRSLFDHDLVILDQGIGEQLLAERVELRRIVDLQLNESPHPNVVDALEAERRKRPLDGLSLRVEDALLRADQHLGLHSVSVQATEERPAP